MCCEVSDPFSEPEPEVAVVSVGQLEPLCFYQSKFGVNTWFPPGPPGTAPLSSGWTVKNILLVLAEADKLLHHINTDNPELMAHSRAPSNTNQWEIYQ